MSNLIKCRSCNSLELFLVLEIQPIPLVGEFTENPNPAAAKFPINLFFCNNCKVLLIDQSIDSEKLFNEYSFSSSTIPSLVTHFEDFAKWIVKKINPKVVFEVGCNDGILLKPMEKLGIKTFGVDISTNITQVARNKGLDVKKMKFGVEAEKEIIEWVESVDVITASNTFPHNADPNGFLSTAHKILKIDGSLVLEVMYAGSLRDYLQWDTVYHEHLHFHSLLSLENLLNLNGFYVHHAEIVPMHAGSLRVIATKNQNSYSQEYLNIKQAEVNSNLNSQETWLEFANKCQQSIVEIKTGLDRFSKIGKVWAYGASGRASMWINVAQIDFIEKVVDASPLRANHFMPGSNIPIVSPEELESNPPVAIFVTAWNYFDNISKQHPNFRGTWVTPLPEYKEFSISEGE
jgi:methylation protein EvaC